MFRNRPLNHRLRLSITAAAVLGAAVLTGCSSGGGDISSSMPAGPTSVAKKPAAGPAINDKLKFDQLALDSPVKKVSKNGVSYLVFKYTDMEGNIRTCEFPEGQSKSELLPGDWISTFDVYKKTEAVVVKKRQVKRTDQGVVDFPFVSPKPVRVQSTTQSNPTAQPAPSSNPSPGGMAMPSP